MELSLNKVRLELLESHALDGDALFVSGALNQLSPPDRLVYVRTMKQDFDRLHSLDANFPQLIVVSQVAFGQPKLLSLQLRREISGFERLTKPHYWIDPFERKELYNSGVPDLRKWKMVQRYQY